MAGAAGFCGPASAQTRSFRRVLSPLPWDPKSGTPIAAVCLFVDNKKDGGQLHNQRA